VVAINVILSDGHVSQESAHKVAEVVIGDETGVIKFIVKNSME
jgi:hypothetical protein